MLLTMEEIKAQLRLDEDFDADDRHLQLLACAAQKRTEYGLPSPPSCVRSCCVMVIRREN